MATTTPNFGWPVPTSTDLVKDGATAIEALGDGIDTSLVDLKGGTTGQILAKATSADMDFAWITNDVGDITEVTAGTGISGGGTSGAVTITNSMATAIDAKGDLVAGTGADAFARLAVGANGETLVADSSSATGLKWAKSPNFVGCYLYGAGGQSLSASATTAITFSSESIDTNGFHSTSTNTSRITIPTGLGGKYLVTAKVAFSTDVNGFRIVYIYKNGSLYSDSIGASGITSSAGYTNPISTAVIDLAANDYIEVYALQTSSGALLTRGEETSFMATYLGA